jgi:hypothetical protein
MVTEVWNEVKNIKIKKICQEIKYSKGDCQLKS